MSKPWMKVWKEKLWSSINFNTLNFTEKGAYLLLLTMARDEGEHAGKLCYPNGNPMSISDIAQVMKAHKTFTLAQ